jgi:hypothetical protein
MAPSELGAGTVPGADNDSLTRDNRPVTATSETPGASWVSRSLTAAVLPSSEPPLAGATHEPREESRYPAAPTDRLPVGCDVPRRSSAVGLVADVRDALLGDPMVDFGCVSCS